MKKIKTQTVYINGISTVSYWDQFHQDYKDNKNIR